MIQHLKNPVVIGALGGTIAVIVHYINQKIVKKKETVDMVECAKIFVVMSACLGSGLYFMKKKNMISLLSDSPTGGSLNRTNTHVNTDMVSTTNISSNTGPNTNLGNNTLTNKIGGGNTISSMNSKQIPSNGAQPNLVISDINEVIHTGLPNF